MRKINLLITFILSILIFSSCSSGKKALKNGNYYNACITAIERLRSNPEKKASQDVLKEAYPMALSELKRNIENALSSNNPTKYALVFSYYQNLNNLSTQIHRCPAALKIIKKPEEFQAEENKYRTLAAEESYLLGIKELSVGLRENSKLAYYHFMNTDNYIPHYKDVKEKIQEALYYATFRVVFERAPLPNRFQFSADFFYNNVESEVMKLQNNFVQFYSPEEAIQQKISADQIVVFEFDDFTVGNIRESSKTTEYTRDSVIIGTVDIDGKKKNVYGRVKAEYTSFRRDVLSQGTLSVKILNGQTNRILEDKKFSGEYVWYSSWASYKGDDRALTDEQLRECKNRPTMPPPNQDLFVEFTKPIFPQVTNFLKDYYRRY